MVNSIASLLSFSRLHLRHRGLVCLVTLVAIGTTMAGNETELAATETNGARNPREHVVVFRIRGEVLERIVEQNFERSESFQRPILDAWSEGTADVDGHVTLDFQDATAEEPLPIQIQGQITSQSQSYLGPLITTARSTVPFRAMVHLDFDGHKFYQKNIDVTASVESQIEAIRTRRQRIGSRLLTRVAYRVAPRRVGRYEQAAALQVEEDLRQGIAESMKPVVAELNEFLRVRRTLQALLKKEGYERKLSKHRDHLELRVSLPDETATPPTSRLRPGSMAEVWIYPNENRPVMADVALLWQVVPRQLEALVPETETTLFPLQRDLRLDEVGEWDVIRVGPILRNAERAKLRR